MIKQIALTDLETEISDLINQREQHKADKQYDLADRIRSNLLEKGYDIRDTKEGISVWKIYETEQNDSLLQPQLILFGSGELSSVGGSIHEDAVKRLNKKSITISVITTPAGFQPNVQTVYGEICSFFHKRLQNYHPTIHLISANTQQDCNDSTLLQPISKSDYIFTGPGSPSYAVRMIKDSLLLKLIIDSVQSRSATLALASAATIAFSRYCLPVYELYKVGEDLHWLDGLDVYTRIIGKTFSVIPHLNNSEGGEKTDTSYCFMGKERFTKLRLLLKESDAVIGIDEHTAVITDVVSGEQKVRGNGRSIAL